MKNFRYIWIAGLLFTTLIVAVPVFLYVSAEPKLIEDAWTFVPADAPHTDHSALMTGPYETGQDVTRACLSCHEEAAFEVMQTSHFTWESAPVADEETGQSITVGKANLLNNYCIGVQSNWTGCTRCHAGYGWSDASFDFTNAENVDCLACHDQSGQYVKAGSGLPAEEVDLVLAAGSVGAPTRENCGSCHFNGGGGNGVKHGDLDESLYFPTEDLDVHMGEYDFVCTDCHQTENHQIDGRGMGVNIDMTTGTAECTTCHTENLHDDERINEHVDTVACQTCHIDEVAQRDPTKIFWDWSTAGQADREDNIHEYLRIKGSFVYSSNLEPSYDWFNGMIDRYLLGDTMDPTRVTVLNAPQGDIDDPNAQIWPFKIHRGYQPYDVNFNYFLQPQTVGEDGYWTTFDWQQSLQNGSAVTGLPYSGEFGFAPTEMYMLLSHMIAPADQALQCASCHGETGRMDWQALGYPGDPMEWGGGTSKFRESKL